MVDEVGSGQINVTRDPFRFISRNTAPFATIVPKHILDIFYSEA